MPRIEKVPINSIMETVCAWEGCKNTIFVHDVLPAGWKNLVVASGSLFEKKNLLNADVDGVLCPIHYKELLNLLKVGHFK